MGSGTPSVRTFSFSVYVDGEAVVSDQSLTPVESQEVREISGQYEMLFGKECEPSAAKGYVGILGPSLFQLWFGASWSSIRARLGGSVMKLVVSSDAPEVLSLPWELLRPGEEIFLGMQPGSSIVRRPGIGDLKPPLEDPPKGPLRVLFMACGPRQSLDYVAEEEGLIRSASGLDVALDFADLGTFEELRARVDQFRPQVVHLAGQASAKEGSYCFAFEGKGGIPDVRSASEVAQALEGKKVQCIVLTGCQSSHSAAEGLCHDLARSSLPMAICWPVSMTDDAGKEAIRAFYSSLPAGIGTALSRSRAVIGRGLEASDLLLAFPALYSSSDAEVVFGDEIEAHRPLVEEQEPLPGTAEGYARDFVGRRRDLQKLMPVLRDGSVRALVITGPSGAGKSALATKLARGLEAEGFFLIPIYSSENNFLIPARVMDACSRAFLKAALKAESEGKPDQAGLFRSASQALSNPRLSSDDKLGRMISALNNGKFALVLDRFDLNLGPDGKILDRGVSEIYLRLMRLLTSSRAVFTSERLPEDLMTLPSRAWEYSLGPLSLPDFNRFLTRASTAERRSSGVEYERVKAVYSYLEGYPACLDLVARAISHGLSAEAEKGVGCDDFASLLYSSLPKISQGAISRIAVYEVPLSQDAVSAVVGRPGDGLLSMIEAWKSRGLVFGLGSGLMALDSHKRSWLLSRLEKDQIAVAQRDAGDFLRALAEQRRSRELGLSRLECMLEARGHYLASGDVERARDATSRISGFLMGRGMYYDVRRLNEGLLPLGTSPSTLSWMAQACAAQGDYAEAEKLYQRCLEASADDRNAANSWHGLASIDLHFGRYEAARANFQKAMEIYRQIGDRLGEAASLHGVASIEMALGENDTARSDLERVLELQEALGDISGQASTLHDLIALDLRVPNYKAARAKLERSVQLLRQIGDSSGEAAAVHNMASIDMEIGELDSARDEFQRALSIRQLLGDRAGEASALQGLASAEIEKGNSDAARDAFRTALEIFQEIGDKSGEASSFFQLGIMASLQGKVKEGLSLIALSGIILRTAGSPEFEQVEPVVERLASQLKYSQEQFMQMIRQVTGAYKRDKGKNLLELAFRKAR